MPVLYSDVDGTLAFGDKANWGLVDAIKAFLDDHDDYDLIVWSHAGVPHARTWASRIFGGTGYEATVRRKDFNQIEPGDVVIDNWKLPFVILPRDFTRKVQAGHDVPTIGPPGLRAGPEGWAYDPAELKRANDEMWAPEKVTA